MISGKLKVTQVFSDGTQRKVFEDSNIITDGMGINIATLFATNGSQKSSNFAPAYFQLGTCAIEFSAPGVVGGAGGIATDAQYHLSSAFYKMSSAYSIDSFGESSDLRFFYGNRSFQASSDHTEWGEMFFTSALNLSGSTTSSTSTKEWFAEIPVVNNTKYYIDSIEYRIALDENSLNGLPIKEVGLFAKNPVGLKHDHPMLVAYKKFEQPFNKTKDFSLVFDWSIGFLKHFIAWDNFSNVVGEESESVEKWFLS